MIFNPVHPGEVLKDYLGAMRLRKQPHDWV